MRRNEGVCQGADERDIIQNVKSSGAIGTDKGKEAFLARKPQRRFVRYQRKESKFVINKIGISKLKMSMRYK